MPQRVKELHCIMPIVNAYSVMQHGILSHERAAKLKHHSVAMEEIQERRDKVQIPGGMRLHHYANLYFNARNPMMFKRKDQEDSLCVLRVSRDVLGLECVVLTDQNASSDYVRFLSQAQIRLINLDLVKPMIGDIRMIELRTTAIVQSCAQRCWFQMWLLPNL